MSQYDFGQIDPETTTGIGVADIINRWRDALNSLHAGTTRPSYATAGMMWARQFPNGSYRVMFFDGRIDHPLVDIDPGAGEASLAPDLLALPAGIICEWYGAANAVPAGWGLCNGGTYARADGRGNIVSPDLRGLFVLGWGGGYAPGQTGGKPDGSTGQTSQDGSHDHGGNVASAGAHDHGGNTDWLALSVNQMPQHRHGLFAATRTDIGWPQVEPNRVPAVRGDNPGRGIESDYLIRNGRPADGIVGVSQFEGGGAGHRHGIGNDGAHRHGIGGDGNHRHQISNAFPKFHVLVRIMKL